MSIPADNPVNSSGNKKPNDANEHKISKEALNETAALGLQAVVENLPVGILIADVSGKALMLNKALNDIWRGKRLLERLEQYTQYLAWDAKTNELIQPRDWPISIAIKTGKPTAEYEFIIQRFDGTQGTILTSAVPIKDANNRVIGAVAIAQDTTEHKKAQEELYKNRELLVNVINSSTSIVLARDLDGKLILLNDTLARFYKMPKEKALGTTLYDVYPKEVADNIGFWDKKVLTEGKSIRYEEIISIGGKPHTFTSNKFPLKDAQGKTYGIGAVITDITERKQMELKLEQYSKDLEKLVEERTEKIRKGEQSYRELYESFDEAFIAIDWELNIIHWNKAAERITAIPAKGALCKKVYDVLPEMMSVNIQPYYEALAARKPAKFMMNAVSRQTGKPSVFEISTYPATFGITIIVEDKTEEEQTKRLSTIGQVAGMVGHDLRNPLQTIISELYLARTELTAMPEGKKKASMIEAIQSVAEQVSYMDKIVSDLQTFVRPVEVHKQPVNIIQLIVALLAQIDIPIGIQVSLQIPDTLTVSADPQLLKRVLINLVTNAVQAMPSGGELTIRAENNNQGQVQVVVGDTGTGISEEVKPKIFMPLFTTKSKGQGFGLAVCKRVIEAQGGTIRFESEVGKGTKFIVRLPAE